TKMTTNLEERIFDSQWYKNNIQTPIRSNAIELKLAKNELGQFIKLKELRVPEPTLKKEEVNSIWEYYSVLFPERICKFEEIKYWQIIMWNDFPYLDCKRIVAAAKSFENLSDLSSKINKQPNETVLWLNNLYKLIYTLSGNDLQFRENELIPNLDGNFRKLQELNIDGVGQPILLQILQLFGTNWKDKILYPNSCVDTELRFKTFNFSNVKVDIEKALNNLKDKSTTINEATIMLVQWLEKNENLAVEHFKELYKNRADLFVGAIPDKDSLYAIFRDGVDLSKVKKIIEFVSLHPDIDFDNVQDNMNQYKLLPDTTNNIYKEALELLVAELRKKNVSTIHELLDVLERIKDGELIKRADNGNSEIQILPEERAKLFQSLLAEAIQTTIPHLKSHGYIFSDELDQNSPSVFRVIRNNETIKIIIRPAHGGKYKLFYDGEFDALEAKSTELWLSDGRNVFQETLGLLVKRMLAEGTRFIPTSGFLPGNSI
ncbi:MAG TPA: hypothetical protein PLB46_11470, partial [Chitinophagales bacterium]|nr:hypothetical protein [Chitinophagales bacterium]